MSSAEHAARLLRRLDSLAADFAPHLDEAERQARLPQPLADTLLREGIFPAVDTLANGGLELPLCDALRIYEAAAAMDGSLGWTVMIVRRAAACLPHGWPPSGAQELFAPPLALVAGPSGSASGFAEREPGGYRVRGAWRFSQRRTPGVGVQRRLRHHRRRQAGAGCRRQACGACHVDRAR